LAHSHIFQQKLLNCEPIDLSRFVVDLRTRHLHYWAPFFDTHLRERNSKRFTYYQWCASPNKRALVEHFSYSLPEYMFLDLPHDVIRNMAWFRLRVHTLRHETATWNHRSPLDCDLGEADDNVQDEQHVLFHCTPCAPCALCDIPRWSLPAGNMLPCSHRQDLMMCPLFKTRTTTFFLHELIAFYELASSRNSRLKALSL